MKWCVNHVFVHKESEAIMSGTSGTVISGLFLHMATSPPEMMSYVTNERQASLKHMRFLPGAVALGCSTLLTITVTGASSRFPLCLRLCTCFYVCVLAIYLFALGPGVHPFSLRCISGKDSCPSVSVRVWFQDPLRMPKPTDAQVLFIKCYDICI